VARSVPAVPAAGGPTPAPQRAAASGSAQAPAGPPVLDAWRRLHVPFEVVMLAFVAGVTRFTAIGHPNSIVFDEVYFREYALRYRTGSYYFDLHPPLGKLLLAGWAGLFGISTPADSKDPAVALRILPALAGVALVVAFYLLLRQLTASRKVATFGAAVLLLDNAILVESRLILVDSMLLLFGIGAITCYLAAQRHSGRAHWVLLSAGAVLAGMAVSTKWTGLTALGVIALIWLARSVRGQIGGRRAIGQLAVLLVIPALVYVLVFAIHFALLPNSGPGDAYMTDQFQATLVGNPKYDPHAPMSFVEKFVELNQAIPRYENSLNASTHPYSSTWLTWPLLKRPVYYWVSEGAPDGTHQYIYLQGNPVIWWGLLVGAVMVGLGWLRRPDLFERHRGPLAILGIAWAANFVPFATITRPMFLYHYFFAFMFAIGAVSVGIGVLAGWGNDGQDAWQFPSRRSVGLYIGILAVVAVGFVFFSPISYGLPLSDAGLADRIWLDSWR
jgi:dolichyl-phosphate-mannose-protein mannosyltransferase